MKTGKRWSTWNFASLGPLLALLMLPCAPGCAKNRGSVEKSLLAHRSERNDGVAQAYRVACPDVIELAIAQRSEFNGRYDIGADGRINLGDYGKPRLEGRTPPEAASLIAAEVGVDAASVQVQVSAFKSQHILLFGAVNGSQRSVPYRGPETVLDLLQRVGGITPGAAPNDVYVIRPHVGDNQRPEAFHVELGNIVLKNDHRTNLRVQPFDQIFVGETLRAKVEKVFPPFLRPTYQWILRTKPGARDQNEDLRSERPRQVDSNKPPQVHADGR